jgi:hypothetical protein
LLADPNFASTLESVLRSIARAAPKAREKDALVHRVQSDPERNPVLAQALERLMDKRAYPHVQDLEDEGRRLGVHVPEAGFKTRKDAARSILNFLERLPTEELAQIIERLKVPDQIGTLQEWSNIIMERKR